MTKSEEWEQFSAYRPMIEDAIRRGREQREAEIIDTLKRASAYDRLKRNGQLTDALDATLALIKGETNG